MAQKLAWKLIAPVGLLLVSGCYWAYGVKVDATVDRASFASFCPPEYPIAVRIRNNTLQRLASVDLTLEAWRNGRSENILSRTAYIFDKILPPFASGIQCYSDKAFYVEIPRETSKFDFSRVSREMKEFDRVTNNVEIVAVANNSSF